MIFDRGGTVKLSEEDIETIRRYVADENKDVRYIGGQYLQRFSEIFEFGVTEEDLVVGTKNRAKTNWHYAPDWNFSLSR